MAHQHTALIVEDEPAIRELIADVLTLEGFAVDEAADGVEALDLIDQQPEDYCLLLVDCMLPNLPGADVLRHVRASDAVVPVIAMSASQWHLAEATAVGATCALAKPFDLDTLLTVVDGCLSDEAGR